MQLPIECNTMRRFAKKWVGWLAETCRFKNEAKEARLLSGS